MKLTEFESEIVDSLLWQIQGFKENRVSERATNRILRASIRRIKHRLAGHSVESRNSIEKENENDHAVPVKVIIQMIMDTPNITKDQVIDILSKFYVSVTISKHEHVSVLRASALDSDMPDDWDRVDCLARYKSAGIDVVLSS